MQEADFAKSQVLNDLEQKRVILHQFSCKVGKIRVYVCFVVLFVFLDGERWLFLAYCGMESI